jgi:hypothetical protein
MRYQGQPHSTLCPRRQGERGLVIADSSVPEFITPEEEDFLTRKVSPATKSLSYERQYTTTHQYTMERSLTPDQSQSTSEMEDSRHRQTVSKLASSSSSSSLNQYRPSLSLSPCGPSEIEVVPELSSRRSGAVLVGHVPIEPSWLPKSPFGTDHFQYVADGQTTILG